MDQATLNTNVANAQNLGRQLQSQYNTQAGQSMGNYQNAYGNAQNAQGQLQGFTGNMINGNQLYGQNLANAQSMYGFNPADLLRANQSLARTNTTMANLPQAVQQQGNYYGTTAGQEAGNYAGMAGNLSAVQQGQANTANAFQNAMAATQAQAQAQTGAAFTGQGQQLQAYTSAAANANQIMQTAAATMAQIEQLQQTQGTATAQQVAAYQNAYSSYIQAQAQSSMIQQQISMMQNAQSASTPGTPQYQQHQLAQHLKDSQAWVANKGNEKAIPEAGASLNPFTNLGPAMSGASNFIGNMAGGVLNAL